MTAGRPGGDYIVQRAGALVVVLAGATAAVVGFMIIIYSTPLTLLLVGYLLIGGGCANIVPIMFSQIGKQDSMPQMAAVPAVTTLGYLGVLAGPALIGYIAHHATLSHGFVFVIALLLAALLLSFHIRHLLKPARTP